MMDTAHIGRPSVAASTASAGLGPSALSRPGALEVPEAITSRPVEGRAELPRSRVAGVLLLISRRAQILAALGPDPSLFGPYTFICALLRPPLDRSYRRLSSVGSLAIRAQRFISLRGDARFAGADDGGWSVRGAQFGEDG